MRRGCAGPTDDVPWRETHVQFSRPDRGLGVACIPVLGLLFAAFIGIAWLRAFLTMRNWRAFPLALTVAVIYFVLNVAVLAPVLGEFMAAKWALAFLFTAWGLSVVGQRIDQAQAAAIDDATEARKLDRLKG